MGTEETEVTEIEEKEVTEVTEPIDEVVGSPFSKMIQSLVMSQDESERADIVSNIIAYDEERSTTLDDLTNQLTTANAERDDAISKYDELKKSNWNKFFGAKKEDSTEVVTDPIDNDIVKSEEQIMKEVEDILNEEEKEGN